MTRGLLKSDGPDLSRGFHHGKSRSLITRTPEFAIPDFPKWEISRHVASFNRTTRIYFGVSTMECLDLSSPELLSSRLPISRSGKSLDTWPPLLGRSRSISGLSPLFTGGLTLRYLLIDPTAVGFSSRDLTAQTGS
jgi:hypothetical protein